MIKGYKVGQRISRLHEQHTQVSWLNAELIERTGPAHLADMANEDRMQLVAWSQFSNTIEQFRDLPRRWSSDPRERMIASLWSIDQ